MRRVAFVTAVLAAAGVLAVFGAGAGDGERYQVRAIFDNASFVIAGEDVKVAGVKVGKIGDVEVTRDQRAAVVLDIEDPGFQDFRADASCSVRPQSLIGEKFVECKPTQKRAANAPLPPPLKRIEEGEGEGQYLLPVERTTRNVDLDLLNNIMRRPYAERLSLIISELGTGLAGRGEELNEVIRRANPALKEVDKVVALLADQNKQLEQLAEDSDTALAPLAKERRRVGSFIDNAGKVAEATAERRAELEANIERLPRFLRELKPTMTRLGALADEMSPVVSDLGDVAPDINRMLLELGPFSRAGIPALRTLGDATDVGIPALRDARPILRDLRSFARGVRPVGETLAELLTSFERNKGIERAMDYIFFSVAGINGYDSLGHYLRAALIVNTCSSYAVTATVDCLANFNQGNAASTAGAAAAAGLPRDEVLQRTAAVLRGEDPGERDGKLAAASEPEPKATPEARETEPAAPAPASPRVSDEGGDELLDYLLGGAE